MDDSLSFVIRPGRSASMSLKLKAGSYKISIEADTAVIALLGDEGSSTPRLTHEFTGYRNQRGKVELLIWSAASKAKTRGTIEVKSG